MNELGKLFGGASRVRTMRLFVFNGQSVFDRVDLVARLRISQATATKELGFLTRAGLIRKKTFYKEIAQTKTGKAIRKKSVGWTLDERFVFLEQLRQFLLETAVISSKEILERLQRVGRLRLVLTSGIFMQLWESRLDMLIVGDRFNESALTNAIKGLEAELGRELRYAVLTTEDFNYRRSVQDKLIRDVTDYPHQAVVDKIGMDF